MPIIYIVREPDKGGEAVDGWLATSAIRERVRIVSLDEHKDANWTTPRVRHPEQADRWSWPVLLAYTQLRLARRAIDDRRLPWERPQRPHRRALTPARVRQAFPQLLVALDTPADVPKPCGRSPGRPLGRRSGPARRYPAIKKAA